MMTAEPEQPSKRDPAPQSFIDWLVDILSSFANFFLWIFFGDAVSAEQPGESSSSPLVVDAVPGVTTLLDIALFRAVEAELTGTLNTSHALLQTWLQVQSQARAVLRLVKKNNNSINHVPCGPSGGGSSYTNDPGVRRTQLEAFARSCYEHSCSIVERMTTDRFAQTANLSDPYDFASNTLGGTDGGSSHHHGSKGPSHDFLLNATIDGFLDTGRRRLPVQQRPKDCWESARLYCPDFVWGDDVATQCHKSLRQLIKHPFCSAALAEWNSSDAPMNPDNSNHQLGGALSFLSSKLEKEESTLLLQLVLIDVSVRLSQFKTALEAESVVSKRLYLVKSEYRAPLRAFWEAHSSVQRAPSLKLVEESLSSLSATKRNNKSSADKDRLQRLLETPMLVELLALERQIEEYEVDMASALYPFCELARYLDQKKATVKNANPALREVLSRLKSVLVAGPLRLRSGDSTMSAGLRPLFLDFQGVPRDEEDDNHNKYLRSRGTRDLDFLKSPKTLEAISMRVDLFVSELSLFAKVMSKEKQRKNAFYAEKKSDIDPPSASLCGKFDGERFKCEFLDWYNMAVKQHEITMARQTKLNGDGTIVYKLDVLAEEIRRAEMAVSLSMVSTEPALKKVRDRVRVVSGDRTKRFEILKESLEDLCLREMDLHVELVPPPIESLLELRPTDTSNVPIMKGVFGCAMLEFQQGLPLG